MVRPAVCRAASHAARVVASAAVRVAACAARSPLRRRRSQRVPQRVPRRTPGTAAFAALLLALALAPASAAAQAVTGVGDDAIPIPRGGVRIRVAGEWSEHDAFRIGSGTRPRLGPLATDALGVRQLPQLGGVERALRSLADDAGLTLSLGPLEARGAVRQSFAPLALDVGITRRLSLGLLVPYGESRDISQFILNRDGSGANVGRNPAFDAASAPGALNTNGALLRQLQGARSGLVAELARCADPVATGCDAIRADPAGAQALLARAATVQDALVAVYGDSLRGGGAFVPIAGSPLHAAIGATLAALREGFTRFGAPSLEASASPAAATRVYGPGSMGALAGDSALGLAWARLGTTRRAGIGDVDLTASVLLVDQFGADQLRRLAASGLAVRSLASIGWRFGSATADRGDDPLDVTIGEGASALLLRSTTDVVLRRWAWLSATVRVVQPMGDELAIRVPPPDDSTLFFPGVPVLARRDLGRTLDVELAPRVVLNDFFGVSAAFALRRRAADRYEALDGDPEALALRVAATVPGRTVRHAAVGLSFSTLASYARGRSRFPLEVVYTHGAVLHATGAPVPATRTDRIELRYFTGFPRR